MGDKSNIAWTDATWNPVVGCTKISEGCKHCYAERDHTKRHKAFQEGKLQNIPQYAQPFSKVQLLENRLDQPLKWKRPRKIFVNSLSDLFHPDVPFEFIDKLFAVIGRSQHHIYQILTKRPERMLEYFQSDRYQRILSESYKLNIKVRPEMMGAGIDNPKGWNNGKPAWGFSHVWLGVTAENQDTADHRLPLLLQVPAKIRFVSIEPMLRPIDIYEYLAYGRYSLNIDLKQTQKIHLVICGGESGPNARPLHPNNVRFLRDQCTSAGVLFFFKQWGEWIPWDQISLDSTNDEIRKKLNKMLPITIVDNELGPNTMPNQVKVSKVGTKKAGCLLDGREWKELPEVVNG